MRWFRKKYNLPPKSPELEKYTREELYVDWLEDLIEEQGGPENVALNVGTEEEPILVRPRGDAAEERLARGETDDVFEGLSEEVIEQINKHRFRKQTPEPVSEAMESFSDDYTKGP